MKKLLNFLRRSRGEQLLLIQATVLLGAVVLGLTLLPYKTVLAKVNSITPRKNPRGQGNYTPQNRINWSVAKAGRYIPKAKCLAMAMAVKVLYAREGYPAQLLIGVNKIGKNQIKAHAWLESRGEIVFGNLPDLSRFGVLHALENESSGTVGK